MRRSLSKTALLLAAVAAASVLMGPGGSAIAAEQLPWAKKKPGYAECPYGSQDCPGAYVPENGYGEPQGYGQTRPRSTPPAYQQGSAQEEYYDDLPPEPGASQGPMRQETFSPGEITGAGHRFFGNITKGLASVVEYTFQQQGRPNGYILGEEGGGAFVAGLRYGEGVLHTKSAGTRRVYWQGPSIGYDFGAEGSKTMILVYDMYNPDEVFYDYAGVGGQAYLVGGVGVTFLKSGHVTMAPIRSGLGLRLGANVGYLKFTRQPTWNPF